MSNENRVANTELNDLTVEELLDLQSGEVEHVKGMQFFPTAEYAFTVDSCELGEVGSESKPAIMLEITVTDVDAESFENPEEADDVPELPTTLKSAFVMNSKDGYGVRNFLTLASTLENGDSLTARQLMETLQGMQGTGIIEKRTYTNNADEKRTANNLQTHTVVFH